MKESIGMNNGQETLRDVIVFAKQFEILTGFTPMRWQQRLYDEYFANGALPSSVSMPTGLGKTAVMAIWLVALAQQMKSGQVSLPRRMVYVVDRRAVVDQATHFAEDLRANLQNIEAIELRDALGLGEAEALPISTLRGQFVDNRDWLEDPSHPAIIVGTVDMVGSRLLFEGYGVSPKMRPYHAGLLGADTLVLLDEAHLVPPFEALLAEIAENAGRYGSQEKALGALIPKFQLLPLSATGRRQTARPFVLEERDFRNPDDAIVLPRLFAEKHLTLHAKSGEKLEDGLAKLAWAAARETQEPNNGENTNTSLKPVRVIVYCDSRDVAEKTKAALDKKAEETVSKGRTELFVGARRVRERTMAEQRLKELGFLADTGKQTAPAFLVATSAGEVGIDLDADHLVCDLVAWERMVQRFGRVNRRGGENRLANIVVIDEGEPQPKKQEAPTADEQMRIRIYRGVKQLLEKLRDVHSATISVSPESLRQLNERASKDDTLRQLIADASSPAPLRPALNRALVDAWSMTSLPEHTGRPEIAPWLRGWVDEEPQTTVVWRKYLPVRTKPQVTKKEIEDFFEAAPIHTSETLETEAFSVMKWLKARASKFDVEVNDHVCGILLTVDGKFAQALYVKDLLGDLESDKERHKDIEKKLTGKTLVLTANFGGLKDGLLKKDEKDGWLSPDRERLQLPETADGDAHWMDTDGETPPVIRFRIVERDTKSAEDSDDAWLESQRFVLERSDDGEITRWLSIQKWRDTSNTENDRAEGRPQALAEHQCWTTKRAEAIGKRLGLPEDYIAMLAIAARLHDEGKRARCWQKAFQAERDKKKFGISGDLAKTRGPIHQQMLGGYRHEFGSLPHAKDDAEFKKLPEELQDLALHLIAAHHGYARPLIATSGCDDAPPSMLEERACEVALRFARLQKRWGPWGLAWWESLLRAADVQASRDNDKREKN
ncbi:type I-G CRISPR-associated helicase/endonuclease Cas3g [Pseudacidobacterium ailaaui]|jgi:CRISPR-associated endonuclease/helicase Cas3|uniref:type I-G CRISPR-associated helicase/endonuclease Cas3g n=1 Tax=Pseudacidobacterium ailaaui TaxID=1382359 RepID=UPI00047AB3C6|nr:type I-U CRISPR-associated helicase/endonuclease Cas3 [Pseudacidobacterium ailaaui]